MSRSVWKGPFVDPSLIKKVVVIKNLLKHGHEAQQSFPILLDIVF